MKTQINFQYKDSKSPRPDDCSQDEELYFEEGDKHPYLPNVGDFVNLKYGGEAEMYKVLTRHFAYGKVGVSIIMTVNIVVGDATEAEALAVIKE